MPFCIPGKSKETFSRGVRGMFEEVGIYRGTGRVKRTDERW